MQDDYSLFFKADLTKLPTDVLKSISIVVGSELDKRRHSGLIDANLARQSEHAANKVFEGLRHPNHEYNSHWHGYLDGLLCQDWSYLFTGGDAERKYYVYAHYSPRGKAVRFSNAKVHFDLSGLPFYIGKGTGDRAYDLKRNQGHGETLRGLLASGCRPSELVSILKDGLTEDEALELESKLIYFFGTKYEKHRRGLLVNLDIPARPTLIKPNLAKRLLAVA